MNSKFKIQQEDHLALVVWSYKNPKLMLKISVINTLESN